MRRAIFFPAILCLLLVPSRSIAWNQSEIDWFTISTEHFNIQYHEGLDQYAGQAAEIAEAVYGPLTEFYGFKPKGKIYLNLSDKEDESGGATYYYLNRIDITAAPYDFWFRGSADWLADVITHEFAHMVSVQSSFRLPRWLPSIYLQGVNFEKEKRPDVINGYPNFQMSVPVSGELLPNWFAEGTAQYQCSEARHDIWDSHRDMLLRTAYLNGRLLTLDEMGVFGKTSRGSEMVYNQGFSLVRFIARRFGEDKLRELMAAFASMKTWSFGGPCKRVLGVSDSELYRLWIDDLKAEYDPVAAKVAERPMEGGVISRTGFMNLYPVSGRTGSEVYYLSNKDRDYVELDLVKRSADGKISNVVSNASSRFAFSPGGDRICFTRRTCKNERGYRLNDLYIYHLETKRAKRLTRALRASNPTWSPDGTRIACVVVGQGSHRIAIVDAGNGSHTFLTPRVQGREYTGLSWGKSGILAARFEGLSRDIVLIDPVSGSETALVATIADERDPAWDDTGSGFFYASDRMGIFNIYYHGTDGAPDLMVTNCIGGAFSPAPAGDGLVYEGYGADGFDIRRIALWRDGAREADGSLDDDKLQAERLAISVVRDSSGGGSAAAPLGASAASGSSGAGGAEEKRFGIEYTGISLYPRFMIYENKLRAGLFLDSGDYLSRQSFFAGASANGEGDFDLYLSVETRQFKPTFGFDVFRNRKYYSYRTTEDGSDYDIKVRYDLWDAFFSCKMELEPTTQFSRKEAVLQFNHGEYGLNLEVWELLSQREFRGEGGWNYYVANELSLLLHYRNIRDEIDADINPRGGRSIDVEITRAYDKLHSGDFEFAYRPVYNKDYFGRYSAIYEEYIPLPFWRHALTLHMQAAALDRSDINDFFYLYVGSRDGLRGYSYFSMGGRKIAMARLTYRFPVWKDMNQQVSSVYIGSLYAGVFAEAGKAWNEDKLDFKDNKKDVGFDLRLKGFTFYSFPLAASLEAAYGLDDVVYKDPFNTFTTFYEGHSWKFYGSVLFSF
ncbi:MAG: hypothetical protein PHD74_03470 [Candidatus Krumholzibacteria bacterium]|nr:hypothetical protein [Candidatus Krumholzibacteria bacterium]